MTRSKEEAGAANDAMSGWSDPLAGGSERRFAEQGLRMLGVKAGESFLEIGFGTGRPRLELARSVGASARRWGDAGKVLSVEFLRTRRGRRARVKPANGQ
ncbi:MAG: hypothetical protein JW748_01885 [Anaerolineales bacterium]|nr:hypothetical protein [Anaerolineales bacterium]